MARRYQLQRMQVVTLGTLVAFGMGLTSEGAGARSLRSRQIPEAPQNTMSSAPIMAIVSIASQQVGSTTPTAAYFGLACQRAGPTTKPRSASTASLIRRKSTTQTSMTMLPCRLCSASRGPGLHCMRGSYRDIRLRTVASACRIILPSKSSLLQNRHARDRCP